MSLAAAALASSTAAAPSGPGQPLQILFSPGATSEFRIQLTVTARVEGQQTETIGAKTYVAPFAREAKSILNWRAQIRIASVTAGNADIEESLTDFSAIPAPDVPADPNAARMAQAANAALSAWAQDRTIHYRESPSGETQAISPESAPQLDEQSPHVLSAWLIRALRPAVALPAKPVVLNDHWQEARSVTLENWSIASGSETGEWLPAADGSKLMARLDDVQQISATISSGPEKPPEGAASADFRGESLGTVALEDGRLVTASRSAARTIVWTLTPTAGLPAPPRFSSRLIVEIQIENCDDTPCDNLNSDLRARP